MVRPQPALLCRRLRIRRKKHGFGSVTVHSCNHYGIAGYYAKMAARADFTGGSSTNTEAIAIPTFGKQPMLGTSPLAFCMPADPCDFLFDCATAVVPRGKITWPPSSIFSDHTRFCSNRSTWKATDSCASMTVCDRNCLKCQSGTDFG